MARDRAELGRFRNRFVPAENTVEFAEIDGQNCAHVKVSGDAVWEGSAFPISLPQWDAWILSAAEAGTGVTMAALVNRLHPGSKVFFIRPGRYHLFGTDFEDRDNMPEAAAIARFDEVWTARIKDAVLGGDRITYQEALRLIGDKKGANYCKSDQEHCQFVLGGTMFVAQVDRKPALPEHNQLWAASVRNFDTRAVLVTFETQEEREAWAALAHRHRCTPEELGLVVLGSFLSASRRLAGQPEA
jgi:hypothetical protein